MDNQIELKPCPFCGGKAVLYGQEIRDCVNGERAKLLRKEYWVKTHCDITCIYAMTAGRAFGIYDGIHYRTPEAAAEAWNRRTELNAANKWISVDKRVPETNEPVLVWYEYFRYGRYNRMYQTYGIARYFSEVRKWLIEGCNTSTDKVLYWCPLPPPMKIEEPPDDKEEEEVLDE